MFREKRISVVVPAFNEERLIARTLSTMPDFVDDIIVVDDHSSDATGSRVRECQNRDPRIHVITHSQNRGVGGAISSGYQWCRDHSTDVAVVMAGDGQMAPEDLPALIAPVVEDLADYSKGNRLVTGEAWKRIPRARYLGNSGLTFLTKIASGYWHVTDSQCGYTALNRRALDLIPLESIYPRYGMPNDFLVTLNIYNLRVCDVPVQPIYGIGERSGFRAPFLILPLSLLMFRLFLRRMFHKYIVRDFHPLVLFYFFGLLLCLMNIPLGARLFLLWNTQGEVPPITALSILFCSAIGFQFILFAMLFDMEANRDLKCLSAHRTGEKSRLREMK